MGTTGTYTIAMVQGHGPQQAALKVLVFTARYWVQSLETRALSGDAKNWSTCADLGGWDYRNLHGCHRARQGRHSRLPQLPGHPSMWGWDWTPAADLHAGHDRAAAVGLHPGGADCQNGTRQCQRMETNRSRSLPNKKEPVSTWADENNARQVCHCYVWLIQRCKPFQAGHHRAAAVGLLSNVSDLDKA